MPCTENLSMDQKTLTVPGVGCAQMVPNQILLFSLSTWKLLALQMLIFLLHKKYLTAFIYFIYWIKY